VLGAVAAMGEMFRERSDAAGSSGGAEASG